LHHPDDLVHLIYQNLGTGNTYVAKYFQHILHDECVSGGGRLPLMTMAIMVILLVIGISM